MKRCWHIQRESDNIRVRYTGSSILDPFKYAVEGSQMHLDRHGERRCRENEDFASCDRAASHARKEGDVTAYPSSLGKGQ
ncbi:hypothetical protein ACFX2I_027483 [Malus domestica]